MAHSYQEVSPAQRLIGKLALLVVILALIGNVVAFDYIRPYGILHELGPIAEAREMIHTLYVDEVDDQALIDAALRGMANALDDVNTQYLSAKEYSAFNEHVGGKFTGIGAEIDIHQDRLRIIAPLDNSPAWNSGVLPGDIVLEIDGKDTLGIDIFEAMRQLKGEVGTAVTIKVRHRTDEVQDLTITRDTITVASVRGYHRTPGSGYDYMIDSQGKIAYLRLTQFGETSLQEVKETLAKLKSQGMNALILDLRNNGGGLLDGAAGISDLFLIGGKTIVSTKGKSPTPQTIFSTDSTLLPDLPLVVLINENSASASEIVAGALRDNDRALVVGARSFGKGSVQQLPELSDGAGALKLTTAHWYLPSGRLIHRREDSDRWGVDPSPGCYVPMDDDQTRAMLIKRRESEVQDPFDQLAGPVTPQWLREEMLDDPLAAALQAAQQMLAQDGWPKVGIDIDDAPATPTQRETLEQRRQALLDRIKELDDQLEELPEESKP